MNRSLKRSTVFVPPVNFIPHSPNDILDATSIVVPKKRVSFVAEVVEEELDDEEEQLVRHSACKVKGSAVQETGVFPESGDGKDAGIHVPSVEVADTNKFQHGFTALPPSPECWFNKELQDLSC
ncbi:hypothetical protein ACOSQ4_007858 [Xanthoceras sorbifolium]